MIHGLLLLSSLLVGQVDPTAGQDLNVEVRRLVRQLDATSLDQRNAAEAELLRLGPEVLDRLPPVTERTGAEVRQRLARVRQRLQQQAAEAAVRASTVTVHDDAIPLAKLLAEFQRQTGNRIVDYRKTFGQPVADPAIRAQFDKTPFWQALDQTLAEAKLTVYPFAEGRAIHLVGASDDRRPTGVCYSGPFRLEATDVSARRDLRRGAGTLVVNVEVLWEPRLRIIAMMQPMGNVAARDEQGRTLPVADAQAQLEISTGGEIAAVKLGLPLRLPPRDARRIASLKGSLRAIVPGRIETFRFEKLAGAKNVEQRIAGTTVTVEGVRRIDRAWEVRMRVRFDDAGDALASHRTWIFSNESYLEGPDGKAIAYAAYDTTRQEKNEVGIAYRFNTEVPLEQMAFVYKAPGVIVDRTFEYELKDLELP